MPSLLETERSTYAQMWAVDSYATHSPGASRLPAFQDMAKPEPGQTVLDAGCGAGKGALALATLGLDVRCCDLTNALLPEAERFPFFAVSLWDDLTSQIGYLHGGKVDWVYCCDVLEHIPPTFAMLVVRRLLDVARYGVFLSICLEHDQFGVWVGKPLHQTVQTFPQWRDQLNAIGRVTESRDLLSNGLYLVSPC